MPVTIRAPRGTTTRAPIGGTGAPSGTAYVRRSRFGTGTATWTSASERASVVGLKETADNFHIFPHLTLRRRVAQQVGGVEGRDQLRAAIIVDAAAQPRDRIERAQQRLCG